MTRLIQIVFAVMLLLPGAARADTDALYDAMGLDRIVDVMRAEGLVYGAEMATDFLNGMGGPDWDRAVDDIYDTNKMTATLKTAFDDAMGDTDTAPLIAFFNSEVGSEIVALEISAREALLDDAVDEASRTQLEAALADDDPRLTLIRSYIDANDLVESNVVGALNSNYAFYSGLVDGGAFPFDMTEDQIIRDVWEQEQEIRAETEEWIQSYLLMAYQPLSDAQIESYITLSKTPEGAALNRALFESFNTMFTEISRALGLAASIYMGGQEL
ncbi:MAG: hypothetical protein AAFQ32_05325 [Pseudomonadota bacterium]